jgi:hypothetical protein
MSDLPDPKDLEEALLRFIVTSRLPFSIVSDRSLQLLLQAARNNPKAALPHRTNLSGNLLNKLHSSVLKRVKQTLCLPTFAFQQIPT